MLQKKRRNNNIVMCYATNGYEEKKNEDKERTKREKQREPSIVDCLDQLSTHLPEAEERRGRRRIGGVNERGEKVKNIIQKKEKKSSKKTHSPQHDPQPSYVVF